MSFRLLVLLFDENGYDMELDYDSILTIAFPQIRIHFDKESFKKRKKYDEDYMDRFFLYLYVPSFCVCLLCYIQQTAFGWCK